jgi:hypothetical protein
VGRGKKSERKEVQDYLAKGIGNRKQEVGRGGESKRKRMQNYLATRNRKHEAGRGRGGEIERNEVKDCLVTGIGSRKREEEEEVKVRKCRTTWLHGRGGRKQEVGRGKRRRK